MHDICPTCPQCNRLMKHVRTIPAVGPAWPALLVFFCAECNQAETQEEDTVVASPARCSISHNQVAAG